MIGMIGMIGLSGCGDPYPEEVNMVGYAYDAPYLTGEIAPGETLRVKDLSGAAFSETVTGQDGSFTLPVPAGDPFFFFVEGAHPTTAFSGTAGLIDLYAGEGLPWFATDAFIAALREEFVNCPTALAGTDGVPGGTAVVAGEVRLYMPAAPYTWEMPTAPTASVELMGSDGEPVTICLLDDDGVSVEYSDVVGSTGRFAAFGVPEGPLVLGVSYQDSDLNIDADQYRGYAPEGGLVSFYPILVQNGGD